MLINPFVFRKPEPNTFIGGIAKLGGTGVNAPILTAAELADRLGVSESIIKGFKVVGEDVECYINSDYQLKSYAFGHQLVPDANQNITYFHDLSNHVKGSNFRAFGNCLNFQSAILNGYIMRNSSTNGGPFDNCTNMTHCELNSNTIINGYYTFRSTNIIILNLISLERILKNTPPPGNVGNNFQDMTVLEVFNAKKLKQIGDYPDVNYNNFQGIKTNALLQVHIDLLTADNGQPDADILYAVNSRQAQVMFYDDNGNFVETYNPIPEPVVTGIEWSVEPSPVQRRWSSIDTDENGSWFATAGLNENQILKSFDDGDTWSVQTPSVGAYWSVIRSNKNGTWVAAGYTYSGLTAIISNDNGDTWRNSTDIGSYELPSLDVNSQGVWMGLSYSTPSMLVISNDDSYTWSNRSGTGGSFTALGAKSENVWIGISRSLPYLIVKSIDNGDNWVSQNNPNTGFWRSIDTDDKGVWIAVASTGTNRMLISRDDGETWVASNLPESNAWMSISTNKKGVWVALASSGTNRIAVSLDNGETWSLQSSIENNSWTSIKCNSNGLWIGVSSNGTNRILKGVEVYNPNPPLKAFPTAEGKAKSITGGRGGQVIKVTNLNDSGVGSLREALLTTGARTIVFDVSGNIHLESIVELILENSNFTVAGQSAPMGGITISGAPIQMGGGYNRANQPCNNGIFRYIRFRNAQYTGIADVYLHNGFISSGTDGLIFDHCSFAMNDDQAISINGHYGIVDNVTIQRCMFSQNGTSVIFGGSYETYVDIFDTSFLLNLCMDSSHRNPDYGAVGRLDHINNVIANWGPRSSNIQYNTTSTIQHIANHYTPGDYTAPGIVNVAQGLGSIYTADNYHPFLYPVPTQNDKLLWRYYDNSDYLPNSYFIETALPTHGGYVPLTAAQAVQAVISDVGANKYLNLDGSWGVYLDSYDTVKINNYVNEIYSNPQDKTYVLPVLPTNTRPVNYDTNNDGIPNVWKVSKGFASNADLSDHVWPSGYVGIEEYLNQVDN